MAQVKAPIIDGRTHYVAFRAHDYEEAAIKEHAQRRGLTISEHIRDVMMRVAKGEIDIGQGKAPDQPKQLSLLDQAAF